MICNIALVPGDGIGTEITEAAVKILSKIEKKYSHSFRYTYAEAGGNSVDKYGIPLTDENLLKCKNADAVLLGAVGGAKWDTLSGNLRPERALLAIRKELGLFANIRPARLFDALRQACPLKSAENGSKLDLVIVRELTGGIYYGERGIRNGVNGREAFDTECYSELEIERIARAAFEIADKRSKKVVSVDKANVLESSRLWREVVHRCAREFPSVTVTDMLVDNAAMQLVRNPSQFDVIVTSNMFGDILSDEASQITGSIGMLPSASLGGGKKGMYEPVHGSAPDIAGRDIANPCAMILSAAMMLRYSFGLEKEADDIETAVEKTLNAGIRTADIACGEAAAGCKEMCGHIASNL